MRRQKGFENGVVLTDVIWLAPLRFVHRPVFLRQEEAEEVAKKTDERAPEEEDGLPSCGDGARACRLHGL
jgi:hypothetical protein